MGHDLAITGAAVFVVVAAGVFLLGRLLGGPPGDRGRAVRRIRGLAADLSAGPAPQRKRWNWSALPKLGRLLVSADRNKSSNLRTDLSRAGFFSPAAVLWYHGIRLTAVGALAAAAGFAATAAGSSIPRILLWTCAAGGTGYLALPFALAALVRKRQRALRSALPDALDVLVLCLEGGASLSAAMMWVTDEIRSIHPDLGTELAIVHREMQLGLSAGEAFRKFADRSGLVDVRDLAAVFLQSERYGAGIAKAVRLYSDTARQDRQFRAEETAQKAAVKILFPTLLCIFPAIFIVLLGPASFQMASLFSR